VETIAAWNFSHPGNAIVEHAKKINPDILVIGHQSSTAGSTSSVP
jgi:nucleotide-binding universal stress UspA family protein